RSGVTLKTKLRVQIGTVDSNYRGEVGVIVDCIGQAIFGGFIPMYHAHIDGSFSEEEAQRYGSYKIHKGDRIAQAVIQRIPDVELIEVEELGESDRGVGGFGSSGVTSE